MISATETIPICISIAGPMRFCLSNLKRISGGMLFSALQIGFLCFLCIRHNQIVAKYGFSRDEPAISVPAFTCHPCHPFHHNQRFASGNAAITPNQGILRDGFVPTDLPPLLILEISNRAQGGNAIPVLVRNPKFISPQQYI